jgi:OmpA-OmpF porin, OOP family
MTAMKLLIAAIIAMHLALPAHAQSYENLGPGVNSKYGEIAPYITPDGKKLFFVRTDHPANSLAPDRTQDIWFSKRESNGAWSEAKHLGKPFNTSYFNSVFYQSADGNTRLIRGAYKNGSFKGSGFSLTYLTKDGWSEPEKVKVKKYEGMVKGNVSGICMGNDNKTMVLYISEKNNTSDLYVSFLQNDGSWSQPVSLGPGINTAGDETTPFLAADGVTLYFSSDRQGGYGSNDIYMTRRLDESWTSWSAPVNLGPSVNSNDWDAYYTIPASGDYAYMVSGKNSYGGTDIVRIKLKEDIKPNPVVLITGKVLDAKTNQPVSAKIEYSLLRDGKQVGIASSNASTGEYQIILPYGKFYSFKAEGEGYYSVSENMDLTDLKEYKEITRNLYLAPVEVGQVVRLNNIFFEFGKAVLKEESFVELDNVVTFMNKNPVMEIAIAGHTDNVGADEANLKLSGERAKAVLDYLISKGISASRLTSKGYGETQPVGSNDTEEGKQQNRRVEFRIVKK